MASLLGGLLFRQHHLIESTSGTIIPNIQQKIRFEQHIKNIRCHPGWCSWLQKKKKTKRVQGGLFLLFALITTYVLTFEKAGEPSSLDSTVPVQVVYSSG